MLRAITPLDLISLIPFNTKAPPNEAKTRETIGTEPTALPWRALWTGWMPVAQNRHLWVMARDRKFRGLVSIRRRCGPSAWEVDYLRLSREDGDTASEVLGRLAPLAGQLGAEKLFLRLPGDSPWLDLAQEAGFTCYLKERLYICQRSSPIQRTAVSPPPGVRPKATSDDHGLFQLYCHACPAWVRSAEGLTFKEWQETREPALVRQGTSQYVMEQDGAIKGWLVIAETKNRGYLHFILEPSAPDIECSLEFALSLVSHKPTVLCLVPEEEVRARQALMSRGFEEGEGYANLMVRITDLVRRAYPVPQVAR